MFCSAACACMRMCIISCCNFYNFFVSLIFLMIIAIYLILKCEIWSLNLLIVYLYLFSFISIQMNCNNWIIHSVICRIFWMLHISKWKNSSHLFVCLFFFIQNKWHIYKRLHSNNRMFLFFLFFFLKNNSSLLHFICS